MPNTRHTTAAPDEEPVEPGAAPVVRPENPPAVAGGDAAAGAAVDRVGVGYIESIRDNYAKYRATAMIPYGNAVAFNVGDPVPADYPTLDRLKADGLVETVGK